MQGLPDYEVPKSEENSRYEEFGVGATPVGPQEALGGALQVADGGLGERRGGAGVA